jgi:hypothetical protein
MASSATTIEKACPLGEFRVPVVIEGERDARTGKVAGRKVTVGGPEVPDKGKWWWSIRRGRDRRARSSRPRGCGG